MLKAFENKDYRGICQMLIDCADRLKAIGLHSVPHYTTLQKAIARLLRQVKVRRLLHQTVRFILKSSPVA